MSEIAYDTVLECIPDLTEDECLNVFHKMKCKFGWVGVVFIREDAENAWQAQVDPFEADNVPLPDEVWNTFQKDWGWVEQQLCEIGYEFMSAIAKEITS